MSTPSNLYAEKVFSEHPVGLWTLDDRMDYLDLVPQEIRLLSSWDISGETSVVDSIRSSSPFPELNTSTVLKSESSNSVTCVSSDVFNFNDFNLDLKTFCFGFYFYSDSNTISSIDVGYEYYDTTTAGNVRKTKNFIPKFSGMWMFLSETFEIPSENTAFRLVIKVNYLSLSGSTITENFLVNGITLGQWNEEFNSKSSGVVGEPLPAGLGFTNSDLGVKAYAYGLDDSPGYYVVSNNSVKAKNTGVPIVYGAKGITRLIPNGSKPSLIIPGKGFLHNYGKFKEYTFEMWVRILNDSVTAGKIFGPIDSDDGIWVDGPFIVLKIGNYVRSHYVGEWGKPMLVHVKYSPTTVSLLIDGDTAIELDINVDTLSLPEQEYKDWLGFWSSDNTSVEVDCVGIYSYQVANIVAKRRFVYGQAVEYPENINTAYSGSSVFIDYQFANYSNNYVYPDLGKWNTGIRNNLSVTNNRLSTPNFSLPRLVCKNSQESVFRSNNFDASYQQSELETSFTFNGLDGYLIFDDFNFLQEDVQAFYAIIKPTLESNEEQTILRIESDSTDNYFSINILGRDITYVLFYNGVERVIYSSYGVGIGDSFPVGINIKTFTANFGEDTSAFFGNRGDLRFYVGGTSGFGKSFQGKFYKVGFCNASNLVAVSSLFNERGCVLEYEDIFETYSQYVDIDAGEYTGSDVSFWQFFLDGGTPSDYASYRLTNHIASYTLFVKSYFDQYYFDIAASGFWKDYIPLTSLAKYVKDSSGDQYYDLDFVQFNIDYPSPSKYIETPGKALVWKYGVPNVVDGETIPSLREEFSSTEQKTYEELDNHLYTGYNDYQDLKNKSSKTYTYDTSGAYVKSYVMFEYVSAGMSISDLFYSNIIGTPKNGVIEPGTEWINTKYEVVDGSILYPPPEDINQLAMVTKIEFSVDGILTHKINVKTLEYASQSLSESSASYVGTRFGEKIYPYKKSGFYYDYKGKNPFGIYKKSSPYLYLTNNSGISLKGDYSAKVQRGISIPVNKTMSDNFKITVMQMAMRYEQDFFPYSPMQIFEIESATSHIKFFIVSNSSEGDRGRIYAVNARTGKLENGILFYLNGSIVSNPVITVKEWAFLGMQFANTPTFDNNIGSIRLTAPMTFNSISYYKTTNLQEIQQVATRPWIKIKNNGETILDWDFWYDDPTHSFQWGGILYVSTLAYYGVNPENIYSNYTGTNKTIIDDRSSINLGLSEYSIYSDITWDQITRPAV